MMGRPGRSARRVEEWLAEAGTTAALGAPCRPGWSPAAPRTRGCVRAVHPRRLAPRCRCCCRRSEQRMQHPRRERQSLGTVQAAPPVGEKMAARRRRERSQVRRCRAVGCRCKHATCVERFARRWRCAPALAAPAPGGPRLQPLRRVGAPPAPPADYTCAIPLPGQARLPPAAAPRRQAAARRGWAAAAPQSLLQSEAARELRLRCCPAGTAAPATAASACKRGVERGGGGGEGGGEAAGGSGSGGMLGCRLRRLGGLAWPRHVAAVPPLSVQLHSGH